MLVTKFTGAHPEWPPEPRNLSPRSRIEDILLVLLYIYLPQLYRLVIGQAYQRIILTCIVYTFLNGTSWLDSQRANVAE